jgi:multiple sugar transport system permease protein
MKETLTTAESAAATRAAVRAGRGLRAQRRDAYFALWLILPTLVAVFAVSVYPLGYSLWESMLQVNIFEHTTSFVGLSNYATALQDPELQAAFGRTAYFSVLAVVGTTLLGLVMALVLNEHFVGRGVVRSIVLIPWAMAPVVVGFLWAWFYDGSYGTLDGVLYQLHLIKGYIPWLQNGFVALNLVGLTYIWNQAPLASLLLLAALQAIPGDLYEAAQLDRANVVQRFRYVTLPFLTPMLLLVLILASINAVLAFDLFYVMTYGGPGTATTVVAWLGYLTSFHYLNFPSGTAILYLLTIVSLILAVVYVRLLSRPEVSLEQ